MLNCAYCEKEILEESKYFKLDLDEYDLKKDVWVSHNLAVCSTDCLNSFIEVFQELIEESLQGGNLDNA